MGRESPEVFVPANRREALAGEERRPRHDSLFCAAGGEGAGRFWNIGLRAFNHQRAAAKIAA